MIRRAPPERLAASLGSRRGELPEGELARFFEFSHDVLAIMDRGGRVLLVSPSVARVLGHPIEDIVGRHFIRWVHAEDRSRARKQMRTLLKGGPMGDVHARLWRADGEWVPMRWSLSAGPDRRVYAVGRDSTEIARGREALLRQELAELRLRTAMELHDGILQTLTGAGLQIRVAQRLVRGDPSAAEAVLEALGEIVAAEQREIRLYVDEVKGLLPAWDNETLALPERIETIIKRVGLIWGVSTSVDVRVADAVPGELGRQILRIAQEATVNAARHGGATAISVTVALEGPCVTITVADDGGGFSFLGEYDHEALESKRLGPLSLKHRVENADGRLSIHSTREGSAVNVRLPLGAESTA